MSAAASRCSSSSCSFKLVPEVGVVGHERPPALARDDHAGVLELEVGALDRDDADAQVDRKCPDRRDLLARLPVADGDAVPDLLHDLEVHRPGVRLRYCEYSVHINIHSVHNLAGQCKHPGNGSAERRDRRRVTRSSFAARARDSRAVAESVCGSPI